MSHPPIEYINICNHGFVLHKGEGIYGNCRTSVLSTTLAECRVLRGVLIVDVLRQLATRVDIPFCRNGKTYLFLPIGSLFSESVRAVQETV
jgi:hypothetical protein